MLLWFCEIKFCKHCGDRIIIPSAIVYVHTHAVRSYNTRLVMYLLLYENLVEWCDFFLPSGSVHVLAGKRGLLCFSFSHHTCCIFIHCLFYLCNDLSCLLYWLPLHAEHVAHHPCNHHIIIIFVFTTSVTLLSLLGLYHSVIFRFFTFVKLLPHLQRSYCLCCAGSQFVMTSDLHASTGDSET
jgi:hypothetical protein